MAGNLRERKKAKTKQAIYDAALELFLEKGYDETTIEEITEKAEVAKGTFFNYFPTKDSILFYLGDHRVVLLADMFKKELKDIKSGKEKIYFCLKLYGKMNEDEKEVTALIIREMFSKKMFTEIDPEKQNQMMRSIDEWKKILINILEEGKQQGEFRADTVAERVTDIIIGVYFFTLFPWLEGKLNNSLTDELLARVEVIMAGIEIS